jgi:WD40 repeat protein
MKYGVAAVHHNSSHPLALTFSRDASIIIAAQSDSSLLIYNTKTSKQINAFRQMELGISLVEPTQQKLCVICAPARSGHSQHQRKMSKIDANRLYAWDLHSNAIVGFLKGHQEDIQSIDSCRTDESLISTDIKGCVKLWDLRTGSGCTAATNTGSQTPCAATISQDGHLLAIAGTGSDYRPCVSILDRRALGRGSVSITHHQTWECMSKPIQAGGKGSMFGFSRVKFSSNNKMVVATPFEIKGRLRSREDRPPLHTLLSKSSNGTYVVDDDLGDDITRWYRPEASFTSDSKYIIFGDEGKNLQVWRKMTEEEIDSSSNSNRNDSTSNDRDEQKGGGLRRVALWKGHITTIGPIRCSPKTDLIASGGGNLLLWQRQKE